MIPSKHDSFKVGNVYISSFFCFSSMRLNMRLLCFLASCFIEGLVLHAYFINMNKLTLVIALSLLICRHVFICFIMCSIARSSPSVSVSGRVACRLWIFKTGQCYNTFCYRCYVLCVELT